MSNRCIIGVYFIFHFFCFSWKRNPSIAIADPASLNDVSRHHHDDQMVCHDGLSVQTLLFHIIICNSPLLPTCSPWTFTYLSPSTSMAQVS